MEVLLLVVLHFIPTIIAFCRDHKSKFGILAMNLLLGWTVIFWIWALIIKYILVILFLKIFVNFN